MPVFGAWMAVLVVAFCLAPGERPVIRLAAGLSAVAAIWWGVRRNRADDRTPWAWLAASVALSTAGAFLYPAHAGAGLIIAAYPALAGVLLTFVRRRAGRARDRAALLDALTVTAGGALIAWTFVLAPRVAGHDWLML